jgi:hypothetical protein
MSITELGGGSLAEEEGHERLDFGVELLDDAAEQHCLAPAGATLDPKQLALFVVAPMLEIGMVEDPGV